MGSHPSCIVPVAEAARAGDGLAGSKAARLGSLVRAGFSVPSEFCITTAAYEQFIAEAGLISHIAMELGRRPLDRRRARRSRRPRCGANGLGLAVVGCCAAR